MSVELMLSIPEFVRHRGVGAPKGLYWMGKTVFDYALALAAIPVIICVAVALLVLNPYFNPGPLFFAQERLGYGRSRFKMIKFRTMLPAPHTVREADDTVEDDRITPLGRIMRKLRIDELPNFLNVLRGEMSAIGPRPDVTAHAQVFLEAIPHYHHRFRVKPGITGLAQVVSGYAEGIEATAVKAHYDRLYVESLSARLDAQIALRTVRVIVSGSGAK